MPPRTVPYLPPEVMSLIYAGMNQRNAKTLRTLGRKGNAAAAARGRELSREKEAKKLMKGGGFYHGPFDMYNAGAAENKNIRIAFSSNRHSNSPSELAGWRRYQRARSEERQGRRNVVTTIQSFGKKRKGKGTKITAPGWVGRVVKAANGHYYESRRIPGRRVVALWHRL